MMMVVEDREGRGNVEKEDGVEEYKKARKGRKNMEKEDEVKEYVQRDNDLNERGW